MPSLTAAKPSQPAILETDRSDLLVLIGVASAFCIAHLMTNGRYGFHRDELQFLSDARHLDWGFVAYPPFTPFIERVSLAFFGLSLVGLRLFSVLVQSIAVLVSGLMARDLGGKRLAQVTTALAVGLSPLPIFNATEFQYTSFAFFWWVLVCWFVVRLLKSGNPRWWLAIGAALGMGLETKYSVAFFIAGILGGMLFSRARRYYTSGWFWAGVAVALLIFLPNLIWLVRHNFISYHFLQHIHARDVRQGRADGFLSGQFWLCANLMAAPLWIAGLIQYFRDDRYRMLGWMYFIPVALFYVSKGRFYYVAEAYPAVIAMGTVLGERWIAGCSRRLRLTVEAVFFTGLFSAGAYAVALLVPLTTSGPIHEFGLRGNDNLREQYGWNDLVRNVAAIRDSLPADQRQNFGILVGNYGEQGAIELLGAPFHLPLPISLTNSAWLRGYPSPPPTTLIVIGFSRTEADRAFTGCRLAGHNGNSAGVHNEESEFHPDIFVCGPPREPWSKFWRDYQNFG